MNSLPAASPAPDPLSTPVAAPYGYVVVAERALPGGGLCPTLAEFTLRRKGTEEGARRAAALTSGFRGIVSVTAIPADEAPAPRRRATSVAPFEVAEDRKIPSPEEADEAVAAIRGVKSACEQLAAIAGQKRNLLSQIERQVETIDRLLPEPDGGRSDAVRLRERCERLRELFNQEELESWTITVGRAMDAAWRRLP